MSKDKIIKLTCAAVICALALLAVLPLQSASADNGRWMAELEDGRALNSLSIPGTHDSGATHSIADLSGKCQSLSIPEQLKLGVRFFDIRLQCKNNELVVVHSFVDQATDFADVLLAMDSFLKENPSEFLIVSFKEDTDAQNSDIGFAQLLEEMLLNCDSVSSSTTLPATVGEARGKIHIISRYSDATIGLPAYDGWGDSASFALGEIYVQDHYSVDSAETKIEDIRSAMQVAGRLEYSLVLNFTSCYYPDAFPPTYAGIPAMTINPWLINTLSDSEGVNCVFLCDFITSELADAIIGRNFE